MTTTYIWTDDEKRWLKESHLPEVALDSYAVALLYGNEDSPRKVELYEKNDYRSTRTTYVDIDGKLTKV